MTLYTASVPDNQERFQNPRYIENRDIQRANDPRDCRSPLRGTARLRPGP
jgi:hypothetical protein